MTQMFYNLHSIPNSRYVALMGFFFLHSFVYVTVVYLLLDAEHLIVNLQLYSPV